MAEELTIEPDAGPGPSRNRGDEVSRVLDQVLDEAAPAPVLRPVRLAPRPRRSPTG